MRKLTLLLLSLVLFVMLGAVVAIWQTRDSSEAVNEIGQTAKDTLVDFSPVDQDYSPAETTSKMSQPEIDEDFMETIHEEFDWSTVNYENLSYG